MSTLDHGPHGLTEAGSNYAEAAAIAALAQAEATAPARLLGVAQVAIETALSLNTVDEIKTQLAAALTRIKPEVAA